MPKTPHEALHHLFRDDPDLVRRALKECLGENFPEFRRVAVINSDLTEIKPIIRNVDTALMVETDTGREVLLIEPQSRPPDQAKKRAWLWYLAYVEAYYEVPATLIILTANHGTARKCRESMTVGPEHRPAATLHPLVIGPDNTPFITDPLKAAKDLMLAVMAALAHRFHPEINTALDTLAGALNGIDLESAQFFAEYVEVGLGEGSAHDHWKGIIMTMTYPFASKLREELTARGHAEGRAEGRAEGLAEGRANSLLELLSARGIEPTSAQRELVLGCEFEEQFRAWQAAALTASSADEVFDTDVW